MCAAGTDKHENEMFVCMCFVRVCVLLAAAWQVNTKMFVFVCAAAAV